MAEKFLSEFPTTRERIKRAIESSGSMVGEQALTNLENLIEELFLERDEVDDQW